MVSEGFITNAVTIVVLLILVGTFLLPKKIRHVTHSLLLLTIGIIPILYEFRVLGFTFGEAGIVKYAVTAVVAMAAKDLILDGIKVQGKMKFILITIGIVVVVLAAVPSLYSLGALTFTFPEYPAIINHFMYVIVAITLFISIFLVED